MRQFHLGDVLSITTGRLVSLRHMQGVHEILDYMTGDTLFSHQLPRAERACQPALQAQHPQLKDVDVSGVNKNNWRSWLDEQVSLYSEELPVHPLKLWNHVNPITELVDMVGKDKIIVVEGGES